MFILKKDNVERVVLTKSEKNRLLALGYTEIAPEEKQAEKKRKKKKTEGAS